MRYYRKLDAGSLVVISITFVLFAAAVFTKDFTHDLLLEAGVFMVSVKLIMMAHRSNIMKESIEAKLDSIQSVLNSISSCTKQE